MFRWIRTPLAGLIAFALCGAAPAAEPYPSKPIRFVLGVGTGGVGDVTMRLFAQQMSKSMGQQIVVDNRPGAGGIAAAMAVIDASPDGYTLLQAGNAAAISASLFKKMPFDVMKDFALVSRTGIFQLAVVATPQSGFNSLADMVAFARKNPRKLNVGTINVGSTQYLAAELFKSMAGIEMQTIPFKSNTLLITSLRANELHLAFELLGPVLAQIKSNSLKALAVGSDLRFPGLPDVRRPAEINDGLSQTIAVGEKAYTAREQLPASWYWDEPLFVGGSDSTVRDGSRLVRDGSWEYRKNWGSAHLRSTPFVALLLLAGMQGISSPGALPFVTTC